MSNWFEALDGAITALGILFLMWRWADALGIPQLVWAVVVYEWRWTQWWVRWRTFDTWLGWFLNSRARRMFALGWMKSYEEIEVPVSDGEGWSGKVWIVELSEEEINERTKFLTAPGQSERGRRGRSARGRQNEQIQIQRLRQYNFERSITRWDFKYPEYEWVINSEGLREKRKHPKAGEDVPVNRQTIGQIRGKVSEQIEFAIDDLNSPPDELMEVRDESGEIVQEEEHSPTEQSYAAR